VATTQEIRIYRDTNGDGVADKSHTFATGWPFNMHYFDWTFGLRFGPDGWLYSILCTDYINPKPAPDPQGLRGSLLRISPDGKTIERFAYGLRFSYGLAFNESGDLFFSDNEGGGNSTEEINHAVKGGNYGHHPKLADSKPRDPILRLQSHMSANGIEFNPTSNDFGGTAGDLFIACWGPDGAWNTGAVRRARLTKSADGSYTAEEFPFSDGPGKVVSLCFGTRGDLYVAQFGIEKNPGHAPFDQPVGSIYRYIYSPDLPIAQANRHAFNPLKNQVEGDPVRGKVIAEQLACLKCHNADGSGDRLGPDLKQIWAVLGKAGTLESIVHPSKAIATGYDLHLVATEDGHVYQGRLLNGAGDHLKLLTMNFEQVEIPRDEIEEVKVSPVSIMPEGLVAKLKQPQIDDLLSFLQSLDSGRTSVLRIHVGGETLKDAEGHIWEADSAYEPGFYGFSGGTVSSFPAMPDPLAQTNRYGTFSYQIDADNGLYELTLSFAEPYFPSPGARVFSVTAQDQVVIQDLDLVKEVGFGKMLYKTMPVRVVDGKIQLQFTPSVNHAILSAIEVRRIPEARAVSKKP
jgi:putative heme-binding domain-containing protein